MVQQNYPALQQSQSAKYQIKVQGALRESWSDWFDEMTICVEKTSSNTAVTTLTGTVRDQAALHGLLNRIRDLSIPLISVQLVQTFIK